MRFYLSEVIAYFIKRFGKINIQTVILIQIGKHTFKHVAYGQETKGYTSFFNRQAVLTVNDVRNDIPVREHYSFGATCCTRSVDNSS